MRTPSRSPLLLLAGALVVTVVVVLAGVVGGGVGDPGPPGGSGSAGGGTGGASEPSASPVGTLAELTAQPPTVARAGFCDRVPEQEVETALGGRATTTEDYGNGDTALLAEGVEDVTHEHGCRWSTAAGAEARAWVFVPPVTAGRAERLVRLASRAPGCTVEPAAAYGEPGVVTACTDPTGQVTRGFQGLFGDAWLTCTLRGTTAAPAPAEAAEDWCVAVAVAAGS